MLGSTEVKVEPAKRKNGESTGLGFALVVHTSNFEFQVSTNIHTRAYVPQHACACLQMCEQMCLQARMH